jgi:pyruvate/2-oxoglutarate dehydrogenase complex dihydrolipoamide dehydrogenase (E3) component
MADRHPSGMTRSKYDFVVLGGGSGGILAAELAANLGVRVALVEKNRPGGSCLFTGCVPSKALLHVAKVSHQARQAHEVGLGISEPTVDMARVSEPIQKIIESIYRGENRESVEGLREKGIDVIVGERRFTGPYTVAVDGRELTAGRFLIDTGSRPATPPIHGLAETGYLTYADLFTLKSLPGRLLVIGAGPIGMEMSQAFSRLGAHVTVIQRSGRLLGVADEDCSALIEDVFRAEAIDVRLNMTIEKVERAGDEVVITANGERFVGDAVLAATGRVPNVDGLDLDRAGVVHSPRGIRVDAYLRTNQPHIYACGDVIGGEQFTHLSAIQGYQAARNALLPGHEKATLGHAPWTVFTDPEIARVGLTETEAQTRYGKDVRANRFSLSRVDRAQTERDRHGFVKLVYRGNGTILGAHIVAGRAGEMIQEIILAMKQGTKLRDLAEMIHVYPTYSVGIQQATGFAAEESIFGGLLGRVIRAVVPAVVRLTSPSRKLAGSWDTRGQPMAIAGLRRKRML